VEAGVPFGTKWNTIILCCPHCQTAISAQIDPVALKTDIVAEVVKKLKR
jgi:hypothetical protein